MNNGQPATDINAVLEASFAAFGAYRERSLADRAAFLEGIAGELERAADAIIETAARETHLAPERLRTELQRTQWQLYSYGQACKEGAWLDIRIDTPGRGAGFRSPVSSSETTKTNAKNVKPESGNQQPETDDRKPETASWKQHARQNDLRKMLVPLGPVVVFGASNFPFAYSTAGGDTACALAAGCPVIVKAHPAHAATSRLVAEAVVRAARMQGLPEAVFQHVAGDLAEGQALVQHPLTRAVGFTGSLAGGRALFDLANARPEPIPVFAEMGSVNPVFLLPGYVAENTEALAKQLVASFTASVGQMCTNPGLLIGIEGESLSALQKAMVHELAVVPPAEMLHPGIAKAFQHKRAGALDVQGVKVAGTLSCPVGRNESIPTLATVSGDDFLANPLLQEEVFGPYSLLVRCRDEAQLLEVARSLKGQLTTTIIATENELAACAGLLPLLHERCGRLVRNGVPTGVEVVPAMMHGGPYPATTDSRFTAVGADGIRRFARPLCYQNWEEALLPRELQSANPLGLWRTVNGVQTRDAV
ncbi:aldehyde dehydrogenase (NADP(+)) [Flaviaesturariibacter aridisoli]|nr:aldehyde dehydrogenase (NADP(+)) [Flaviaesturariibacter aridisoli]